MKEQHLQLTGSGIPDGITPWTSSNPPVATVDNAGLVTGIAAGSTTITYTDNNGCQNSIVVDVNVIPTISGTTSVCTGFTTTLTGSGTPDPVTPWTSANVVVATVDNAGVVTGVSAGSSTITYTNSAGCQQTIVVTVNATPSISGPASICGTGTIALSGTGTPDGTTPWTSSNPGVATVDNTGNVTGVSAGTTTITYLTIDGCQETHDVTVNDNPTITGAAQMCIGETLQLGGSGTPDGTTPWTSSNPGVATIDNTGLVTAIATGQITVTYLDNNGCQNTDVVDVLASPVINPILDQVACDVYVLPAISGSNLTGNVSYWDGPGGTGTQYFQSDVITSSMTIFMYDVNGPCVSEESFTITITSAPILDVVSDTSACGSFTLPTILGQNLTGNEAYYNDSQANGGTILTGPITTSQTVWIYDGGLGCEDETSFFVTVIPLPTATISGGGVYCQGDAINDIIVDLTGTPDWTVNYTLDGTAQVATGSTSPLVLANTEGTYVLVDVSDSACTNTATGTEVISITPTPSLPTAGTDAEYCSTAEFEAMTATGNGGTLNWYNDAGLTNSIGTGESFVPLGVNGLTTYYVTETINGCEGPASTVEISIVECEISVPTAFTPNGDNSHDTWELVNLDEAYPNNVVRVYNRWGGILFESEPGAYGTTGWDGTYNGDILPVGSYYFIIELNNDTDDSITGTVTIILE